MKVKINKKVFESNGNESVFELAKKNGIYIPQFACDEFGRFCTIDDEPSGYEYSLKEMSVCEINGKLENSCSTQVSDGMEVLTESDKCIQKRKEILGKILSFHPYDCLNCVKLGECKLQKYCDMYGVTEGSEKVSFIKRQKDMSNKFYYQDFDKCIRCGKCVKICKDLVGVEALEMVDDGKMRYVVPHLSEEKWKEKTGKSNLSGKDKVLVINDGKVSMADTDCVSCGNCVSVCPVGALMPKAENNFRAWETKKCVTTCTYCGVGCQIEYLIKDGKIVDAKPKNGPSNQGLLCVKGKFAFDFVNHKDRLKHPMIRKNGKLVQVSWNEALDYAANKIKEIKEKYGPDALAGFASARTINEDNYLFQKMVRAAFGTNNVDHCARLCHSSTVAGLATTLGSGAMTNTIVGIKDADLIFVTGSNTTEAHPVMGMYIRQAKKAGKKLIVADPVRIPLAEIADLFLQINPGTSVALTNGMLNVIFEEGLEDKEYIKKYTEGIDDLKAMVKKYTPEYTGKICGLDPEDIKKAARMYASTKKSYITYAMGITQHLNGTDNVSSMSNLALVTGNLGHEGCGVNPLRGQNNVQGACDMGALPTDYPAYQKVFNPEVQEKFEKAWGVKLSPNKGYTVTTTIPAIIEDKVKLLYIMGENPMVSDPDSHHVAKALDKAFVIQQDIFLNETSEYADVVFPVNSFAEKDGTFTNTERRVQRIRALAKVKGESKDDWWVLMQIMNRVGYKCHYNTVEDIFNEMRTVTPSYAGMTYPRLEKEGLHWPCPTEDHPGTPILHTNGPIRNKGVGLLKAMEWLESPERQDPAYPITLVSARILYHYHTRTMTDKSRAVHFTAPRNWIEINVENAKEMNISNGDWLKVTSKRGSIFVEARVSDRTEKNVAWMPFHYANGANVLSDSEHLDPVCSIPGFKQIGIKIEKVSKEESQELAKKAEDNEVKYYLNEDPLSIKFKEDSVEKVLAGKGV